MWNLNKARLIETKSRLMLAKSWGMGEMGDINQTLNFKSSDE